MNIREKLEEILGQEKVLIHEDMSRHTTFRIGGPADYYIMPGSAEEVKKVLEICKQAEIPYFILGNGSNLLVGDGGYRGVVIQIYKNMSGMQVEGEEIRVQAGASLASVARTALDHELTGFEFAGGIPGTVGGAVVMNAGAYGGELKDVLKEVTVLDENGNLLTIPTEKLELGYRTSIIKKKNYLVLEAVISLQKGEKDKIQNYMAELRERRVSKQPLEYPSAGSTFKRPEGYFAGKLIMDAGLAGYRVGGAMVSEKHCGFVINYDHACAADVRTLMQNVIHKVKEVYDVTLEPEIKFLGEF